DLDGNPIEFAAVVVWAVVDTAEAMFSVDSYENYVKVQSEAALRNLATSYPYDAHEDHVKSLRGNTAEVAKHLAEEIQERLADDDLRSLNGQIEYLLRDALRRVGRLNRDLQEVPEITEEDAPSGKPE